MKEFIKNNLFVVVLGGATFVFLVIWLVLGFSITGDKAKLVQERLKIWDQVRRMPMVNPDMKTALQEIQATAERKLENVEKLLAAQAGQYKVLEVTDTQGKLRRAFPYDRDLYESLGLSLKFTSSYVEKWGYADDGWLKRLSATRPPTSNDSYLQSRTRHWEMSFLNHKEKALGYLMRLVAKGIRELEQKQKEMRPELDVEGGTELGEGTGVPERRSLETFGRREYAPPVRGRTETPFTTIGESPEVAVQQRLAKLQDIQKDIPGMITAIQRGRVMAGEIEQVKQRLRNETDPAMRRQLTDYIERREETFKKSLKEIEGAEELLRNKVIPLFDLEEKAVAAPMAMPGATTRPGAPSLPKAKTDLLSEGLKRYAEVYVNQRVKLSDAESYAWPEAILASATAGRIYASPTSLDMYYDKGVLSARPEDLWKMQINSWVMEDILKAIENTIEEVLGKLPPDRQNVIYSPIKQLVKIDIDERYFHSPEAFGPMAPAASARRGLAGSGGQTLTRHACDKEYDVMHYEFTVVMPQRHLWRLQRNLMMGKMHTVLKVDMAEPQDVEGSQTSGPRPAFGQKPSEKTGRYYYGPEPVMAITIHGELLLHTSWSRSLMPTAAIKEQLGNFPATLREEDGKRLGLKID